MEGAESFRITIVSTEYVTSPSGGVTVTVEDNDGKYSVKTCIQVVGVGGIEE